MWIPAIAEAEAARPSSPPTDYPQLDEVLRRAAERSPEVQLAESEVEIGRAEFAGARLPPVLNPYVELTGERTHQELGSSTSFLGSAWLPLEISGQRSGRLEEAGALVRWRQTALAEVRARSIGEALRAFGAVIGAAQRVAVLEDMVKVTTREAELYRSRLSAGDAPLRESKLAEAEAARSRALLRSAQADFEMSLEALNRATGMSYRRGPDPVPEPPRLDTDAQRGQVSAAPGPLASAAEATYFDRRRGRLRRESVGPFSLILQGGAGTLGEARIGGGLAYTLPVFQRGQAEQARSEAQRRRALKEMDLKRTLIRRRVQSLELELERVRQAVEVLTTAAIPAEEAAVQAAVETHRSGKGDWIAVLVSRRDLGRLQLERLELIEREWRLVGGITSLTGITP